MSVAVICVSSVEGDIVLAHCFLGIVVCFICRIVLGNNERAVICH